MLLSLGLLVAYFTFFGPRDAHAADYDLILRGGDILDGSGGSAFRADIGIRDGRIAAIEDLAEAEADRVVDVSGLTVVPGFIDLHSHADGRTDSDGLRARNSKRRAAPNLVTQGVTTVVVNQDGRSPLNIDRQRNQLESRRFGPNAILMVGHNTIRRAAMQGTSSDRPATLEEIETMQEFLREGLEAGAWGMSAGLEYEPGIWSDTRELIELVREIVPYEGVYIVHERSSGADPMWYTPSQHAADPPTMLDSVLETIRIGEETGATVVATHIKARGTAYWGESETIIGAIESARDRGVRVYADQYPYTSSGSDGTVILIPDWILERHKGNSTDYVGALMHAIADPAANRALATDIAHRIARRGGAKNIIIFRYPDPALIGKSLAQVAEQRHLSPIEAAYLLQFEGFQDRLGGALLRGFSMSEDDIRAFAAKPWVATASDAGIALPDDGLIHARYYGTFPRKIRRYALDDALLTVEQAIRSMTSVPAEILGLSDRGLIKTGYHADLAVIDFDALRDRSTYFDPHRYADGIPHVMVNGEFVVTHSSPTFELPGRVLLREPVGARKDTDD